ncbi:MAG: hypothetical protein AAGJ46_09825 [Planctomycetota bacterium]
MASIIKERRGELSFDDSCESGQGPTRDTVGCTSSLLEARMLEAIRQSDCLDEVTREELIEVVEEFGARWTLTEVGSDAEGGDHAS